MDLAAHSRHAEANAFDIEAITLMRALAGDGSAELSSGLASALHNAALHAFIAGDVERALPHIEEAVGIRERLAAGSTGTSAVELVISLSSQAIILATLGKGSTAAKAATRTLTAFRRIGAEFVAGHEGQMAAALQWCLQGQGAAGDVNAGLEVADELVQYCQRLADCHARLAGLLPLALLERATLLEAAGRIADGEVADRQAVAAYRARRPVLEADDVSIDRQG